MTALHERETHLEQVLHDSEKARNDAEALAAQHRRELAQAADQVRALIEEARKEAQVAANSIIQKAQSEAEASRLRAERRDRHGAEDQALMEIWSQTADAGCLGGGQGPLEGTRRVGSSPARRDGQASELPANGQGRSAS